MSTAGGPGRAAGWYPDPSGSTGKFRWWDGTQWTQSLSESLWAPAPRDPQPYHALEATPARRQYIPEFDLDLDEGDSPRRRWLVGGVVVAVVLLIGVLVSLAIWFGRSGASTSDDEATRPPRTPPADSSAPTRTPSKPPSAPPSDPSAPPSAGDPDPTGGRLVFDRLPNWVDDPGGAELLPNGQAQRFTTETGPKGERNDASIASGEPPFAAKAKGDVAAQARTIAEWFVKDEAKLEISKPISGRPSRVDGREAYTVRTQMEYRFEGIESTHDDVEVVVISYGKNRPPGVYIAVVPETHPQLWRDVETAKRSLHLAP